MKVGGFKYNYIPLFEALHTLSIIFQVIVLGFEKWSVYDK